MDVPLRRTVLSYIYCLEKSLNKKLLLNDIRILNWEIEKSDKICQKFLYIFLHLPINWTPIHFIQQLSKYIENSETFPKKVHFENGVQDGHLSF